MTQEEIILVHAESDARFDGYDSLHNLSRVMRQRYIDRARAGYEKVKELSNDK